MMLSDLNKPLTWLLELMGVSANEITSATMKSIPAVFYALQKISGDVGKMPFEPRISKADGRGSDQHKQHPAWRLLRDEPNYYQTSDVFKELIQMHALSYGNGRAWIRREGTLPVELIPLLPDRTDTVMVGGQKYHVTQPESHDPIKFAGTMNGFYEEGHLPESVVVMPDRDVLHIMGLGADGVKGYNIGKVFEDVLTAGSASHKLVRRQTEKGFTGKIMLTDSGGAFSGADAETRAEKFLKQFRETYSSEGEGQISGMLRRGMTAEVLTMSNADAQLLGQMQFNRQDVMLIFGLPHMPGDTSSTGYASLEQNQLQYLASTLDRWLVRWELQADAKLRTEAEKAAGRMYFKYNTASWLKTDAQTTANVFATHIRSTVMNPNEARERLDLNPRDGGDDFLNPAIQVKEPQDDTRADQARNTLQRMIGVEAKRVIDIVSKKSLKDADDSLQAFYRKWSATMLAEFGQSMDVSAYIESRTESLRKIHTESRTLAEFRTNVTSTANRWSADDVF